MAGQFIVLSLISAGGDVPFGCHIVPEGAIYPMIYRPVYGPASYMDCYDWIGFNCKPIERWWEQSKASAEDRERAILSDKSGEGRLFAGVQNRRVELGNIAGVPEVKVEWEGNIIKYPVFYHRDSKIVAYAEFSAPDLDTIWGDITTCAAGAAVGGVLAAIFASPAAAVPAFKAAFMACIVPKLGERAKEIEVALSVQQEHGDWHRV